MKKILLFTIMSVFVLSGFSQTSYIWDGSTDATWDDNSNWTPEGSPTFFDDVTIPSAPSNQPIVVSGTAEAKDITIESGATLTINASQKLYYLGDITVNGTFTVNGTVEKATVTSANNEIWIDRSLGATQVATSSTDTDAYGDLYQWGRLTDGHESRTSDLETVTKSTGDVPGHGDFIAFSDWRLNQNDALWQGVNGTNNPCPSGFRLPTKTEWETEIASWSSQDPAGAFASPLKLTTTGYREWEGVNIWNAGTIGYYWSSTPVTDKASHLVLDADAAMDDGGFRGSGIAVRCIKDDD